MKTVTFPDGTLAQLLRSPIMTGVVCEHGSVSDLEHVGVIWSLQVRHPTLEVIDELLEQGWEPDEPAAQDELQHSCVFFTEDPEIAFGMIPGDAWDEAPIFDPYDEEDHVWASEKWIQ